MNHFQWAPTQLRRSLAERTYRGAKLRLHDTDEIVMSEVMLPDFYFANGFYGDSSIRKPDRRVIEPWEIGMYAIDNNAQIGW